MSTQLIEGFEALSRAQLQQHECDNRDTFIAMFVSIAKLVIGHNTQKSMQQSIKNLRQAVETERELCANVRGQLDREAGQRNSVEKMSHQAIEWCEHWRVKASEQAQALQEMTEAKDLATDAAKFWKARCVCATAALKQITNTTFDFASSIDERYNLPTPSTWKNSSATMDDNDKNQKQQQQRQQNDFSYSSFGVTDQKIKSKSKHHHYNHKHRESDQEKKNSRTNSATSRNRRMLAEDDTPSLDMLLAGGARGSLPSTTVVSTVGWKHPDLFSHVEDANNYASNYLYHNTSVHPSHRPSRF